MIKRFILALSIGAAALAVTGCNTVKGAGEDIKSVGQAGDDAIHGRPIR